MTIQVKRLSGSIQGLLCLLTSAAVHAQGAEVPQAPERVAQLDTARTTHAGSLEEIVVTARRKEENIQTVPVAVTALTAEQLQSATIQSAADVQFRVPAMQVNASNYFASATPVFTIRGLTSTEITGAFPDTGVVTYFSELPMFYTRQFGNSLYDLESIQVLRGPQGTLFGRNSTGGAVLFQPVRPQNEFSGSVQVTFGDYDLQQYTGILNVPVSDKVQFRVSARVNRRDGITENISGPDQNTQKDEAGRFGLMLNPGSWLSNYTEFNAYRTDNRPGNKIIAGIGGFPLLASSLGIMTATTGESLTDAFATQQALGPFKIDYPNDDSIEISAYSVGNTTNIELSSNVTLKNIAGYQDLDTAWTIQENSASRAPLTIIRNTERSYAFTEELQLAGKSFADRLDWIVGLYYADGKVNVPENEADLFQGWYGPTLAAIGAIPAALAPFVQGPQQRSFSQATAKSKAVFTQGTWSITDNVSFTAGYRLSDEKRTFDLRRYDLSIASPANSSGCALLSPSDPAGCTDSLSDDYTGRNWSIGFDYRPTDSILTYIASRHGFKTGGFNGNTVFQSLRSYEPEKATDVEVGVKADWTLLGMPIRTNAAVYRTKIEDTSLDLLIVVGTNQQAFVKQSVGDATVEGGELEIMLNPASWLQLNATYARTDGTYDDGARARLGFNTVGDVTATADLGGQPLLAASKDSYTLGAHAELPESNLGRFSVNLEYAWRSKQYQPGTFDSTRTQMIPGVLPSFGIANARVGWQGILGSPIDVAVWGKNLTDKEYLTNVQLFAGTVGTDLVRYGEPRTWGVDFIWHFGNN